MKLSLVTSLLTFTLLSSPLAYSANPSPTPSPSAMPPTGAVTVQMKNPKGDSIGTAWIAPAKSGDKGIIIQLNLHGLPEGTHGIHLHEKASCVGPDFKSAGGHFSPVKHDHGTLSKNGPHAGDLGNIIVGHDGTVQTRIQDDLVDLGVSMKSLQQGSGTSLMIHAKEDDNKSQPAGNAGDRIACGEIPGIK